VGLNFGDLGSFSPLRIRSAPTFFPSLGQPYFGPNILLIMPQEGQLVARMAKRRKNDIDLLVFTGLADA
jgi:hypothetical protein